MEKLLLFLFVLLLSSGGTLLAETKAYVGAGVGLSDGFGYRNPDFRITVGLESDNDFGLTRIDVLYSPTPKVQYGSVTNLGVTGIQYFRVKDDLGIGGGAKIGKIIFHDLNGSRMSIAPYLGITFKSGGTRMFLDVQLADTDPLYSVYGLHAKGDLDLSEHLRLRFGSSISHVESKQPGSINCWGFATNLALLYFF